MSEGYQWPTTVESVVVAESLTVPSQRAAPSEPVTPYEAAKAPSSLGVNLYTLEPPTGGAERTANGLRKRNPRARRAAASATGTHPTTLVSADSEERAAPVNDSPDALRARLAAFRDGVHRGSSETGGRQ
jgi:hypothetical protein